MLTHINYLVSFLSLIFFKIELRENKNDDYPLIYTYSPKSTLRRQSASINPQSSWAMYLYQAMYISMESRWNSVKLSSTLEAL